MSGFIVTAVLLTLGAILFVTWPLLRPPAQGPAAQRLGAILAALVIAATAAVLYPQLSHEGWRQVAAAQARSAGDGTAIQALLRATEEHPDDVPAWLELGRGYLRGNQWELARRSFRRADALSGGRNAVALAGIAQTIMFENNGVENEAALALFERALQIDPRSPQALFYTAVALMHQGALAQSRHRFATLLSYDTPAAISEVIRRQIAALDEQIAANDNALKASAETAIHLHIILAPTLLGRVPAGAPLFVFVRSPQGGPPLAVKRLTATFPQDLSLSAADAVMAGNSISKGQHVQVVARISVSGTPTASAGDLSGQTEATAGATATRTMLIDH